jgi:TctA family transporter
MQYKAFESNTLGVFVGPLPGIQSFSSEAVFFPVEAF